MAKTCDTCRDKPICRKVCDEVEEYACMDHVYLRELPMQDLDIFPINTELEYGLPDKPKVKLTKREVQILTFSHAGLKREDVCKLLDLPRNLLRQAHYELRRKLTIFGYRQRGQ